MWIYIVIVVFLIVYIDFSKKMKSIENKVDILNIHFKEVEMRLNRINEKLDNKH